MIKKVVFLFFACLMITMSYSQSNFNFLDIEKEQVWVDSVMKTLTTKEKIGQLIVISAYSNKNENYRDSLYNIINENGIGNLVFFQGDPQSQIRMVNKIQSENKVPLSVAIDAEWGLGMRLDNTMSFPYQMALGAIEDDDLLYQMGREIASQLKRVGVNINYAPVADVNNNPANPVINYRSFGENTNKVAKKTASYAKGMQDNGVIAVAKHFPGHGDTDTDSHKALPTIKHSYKRLREVELVPFKNLIEEGIGGIMVAHLNIPALTGEEMSASSLSESVITDLLKDSLGFSGIIMTDALEMKGVSENFSKEEIAVRSFQAGNDMIIMPENSTIAISAIELSLIKGKIQEEDLNRRCEKILRAKYRLGLNNYQKVEEKNVLKDLNSNNAKVLNRKLIEKSLTLIENKNNILPFKGLDSLTIASVSVGAMSETKFQQTLSLYKSIKHYQLGFKEKAVDDIKEELSKYNTIVLGLHDNSLRPRNTKIYSDEIFELIEELIDTKNIILVSFRNPYTLNQISNIDKASALLVSYFDSEDTQDLSAQMLFGGVGTSGTLPVSIGNFYKEGYGLKTAGGIRFKYTLPEELGIDGEELHKRIDEIMKVGIDSGAFPGGQVLLAKDQKVFFRKSYGYHTYEEKVPVENDHLYDFASVTKIAGGMPGILKLHDENRFDLEKPLKYYVPEMKWSNKRNIDLRNILAHNGQLIPWIPYWQKSLKGNGKWKRKTFSTEMSSDYPHKLSENLYLYKDYREHLIYKEIKKSDLLEKKQYRYSGLIFYLIPGIVEDITGENFEDYLNQNFYKKLGAGTLGYNPSRYFGLNKIVPTENDTFFRKMQIHGVVHDEGAALMKGVSGNAGLFATSNDLAKLMQMYLNMGSYGGERYINEYTMRKFTNCQYCQEGNRRGLGFEKPLLRRPERGIPSPSASQSSFGHSGFTGTFTWADPENDLLYVFFSNRVYPTRENTKLYSLNIRTRIHQVAYDLLEK